MSRDDATLLDILRAARLAVEFAGSLVIGEAMKRLSVAFRNSHPEIAWKQIACLEPLAAKSE